MPLKAAFFDADGTLLSFQTHQMPASTRKALDALRAQGVKIVVATGRPKPACRLLEKHYNFDAVIAVNGQLCYEPTGQSIAKRPFKPHQLQMMVDVMSREGYATMFIEEEDAYIDHINEAVRSHLSAVKTQMPNVRPMQYALGREVYQVTTYVRQEEEDALMTKLPGIMAARSMPMSLDLVPEDAGKPVGMDAVLQHYGIALEDTIAFGDGQNDIDMLRHAHIGVAMGNGGDAVKAAADYITTSVDEDGIYNALKHFGFISAE